MSMAGILEAISRKVFGKGMNDLTPDEMRELRQKIEEVRRETEGSVHVSEKDAR